MKKLIIGNFKMNTTTREFAKYLDVFLPKIKECNSRIVLCVPYTHLTMASQKLVSTQVLYGSQNISNEEKGSFTGEISSLMVKDLGCAYTIIGHSEVRRKFKETNATINEKIIRALGVNLKVILCIGETKTERNAKKTKLVLKKQLEECLKDLFANELENIVIAYEPIWAIGTGKVPANKEIEESIKDIREVIAETFSKKCAEKMTILYGGSVNENNSSNILKIKGVNGLLVGGACLEPKSFANIVK